MLRRKFIQFLLTSGVLLTGLTASKVASASSDGGGSSGGGGSSFLGISTKENPQNKKSTLFSCLWLANRPKYG